MLHSALNRLAKIPPWLYIVVLGIITFFAHPIFVPSDLKVYTCNALNIYLGKGYVDIDGSLVLFRAPLFPILIAFSYWLLGVSHVSTFWVIKSFCMLNPLIVYVIGKRFFNTRVGIAAALLILTSYTINFVSFRHLDAIWPFFVLFSTASFYLGFEKNKFRYFLLAGISLALAYLVKEVAILFFPVPFLLSLLISDYRKRTYFSKILASYLSILIVVLPWLFYLIQYTPVSGLQLIIGGAGSGALRSATNLSGLGDSQNLLLYSFNNLKLFFMGLWHYFHGSGNAMSQWFTVTPLFVVSWCFILFDAIRGNKHSRIFILLVLLFVPTIYIQGARDLRIGQTLIFYLLSYLAVAVFIDSALKRATQRAKTISNISSITFITAILCLILIQNFVSFRRDLGNKEFIKANIWYNVLAGGKNDGATYKSPTFTDDKNLLDIIRKYSTSPNKLYMANTDRTLAKEVYFNLKGKNKIYYLESQIHKARKNKPSLLLKEQPIYFKVTKQTGPVPISFKAVFKSQILRMITKEKLSHVLVEPYNRETEGNRGLDRYFSAWQAFKRIPLPLDEVSLYEVISKSKPPPALPPIMDIESLKTLIEISSEKNNDNLSFLKECFKTFYPSYLCSPAENGLKNPAHLSDENSAEAPMLNKAGMNSLYRGNHENAIESFKQAICVDPDFTEAYKNLFYTSALMERQKAIVLNPENPVSYFHYAIFLEAYHFYDTALFNIQKAVSLNPKYAGAYAMLGTIYAKQNKHYKAIDAFQKAVNIYKGYVGHRKDWMVYKINEMIGDSYRYLGQFRKAESFYRQAILTSSNPNLKSTAYLKLGVLVLKLNEYSPAIENLQQAVRLDPGLASAYYHLSQGYLMAGDKKSAAKQYKKLEKINPALANKLNSNSGYIFK